MDKKETAGMRPEARAGAVFLTGFMGCGKSTVGGCLSRLLSLPFTDTDARIEQEQKKTISEIFAQDGEEAFRGLETAALARIGAKKVRQVVSTGGGLPLRRENRSLMKAAGTVVFLRVRPETVYERLRGDTSRPLLRKEDPEAEIRRLLSERTPLYEAAADLILDADEKTPGELAAEIARWVPAGERKENDTMKILVINGPNLNFLGIRERAVYGTKDYEYLLSMLKKKAEETGCQIETFQSNHEGAIIDGSRRHILTARTASSSIREPTPTTAMPSMTPWQAYRCRRWRSISRISRQGRNSGRFPSRLRPVTDRSSGTGWRAIWKLWT